MLICGDRNWSNFQLILDELSKVQQNSGVEVVIEGENGTVVAGRIIKGADMMGREAAIRLGLPWRPFPADWRKHGRAAGPIRNRQMLTEGKPTLVLAFHSFIENSKGTKDMVQAAMNAGIKTQIIKER